MTPRAVTARITTLTDDLPDPLRSPVSALASRTGKLLRPRLLLACAQLGTPDPARAVRLAAVVELVHLASLLHDDVIDKADIRRGAPAAHVVVGPEQAMLAGLALLALAGTEAADLGSGVAAAVTGTNALVAHGELLDVERAFDISASIASYVTVVRHKTGALFGLACRLGAAEARLDAAHVRSAARFGEALGVAFQVLDDCLEMESGDDVDKPTSTDHLLGLFGAPTLYALRADRTGELARLLLAPGFAPPDMAIVRKQVTHLGGADAARRLARRWHDRAVHTLGDLPAGPARNDLARLAHALLAGR